MRLHVENLTIVAKRSPSKLLVNGLQFDVEAGRTTCVVGESGSGKSLSALAIMGLLGEELVQTSGRIVFDDGEQTQDLCTLTPRMMRGIRGKKIGMIFQEPMTSLNPVLTVGYQIAEGLSEHFGLRGKVLKMRVAELLERVGIATGRANSYPHELSGGQRQRVMIAMTIACQPQLLIADEPTTALDVTVQAQILNLLQDIKDELGMGMLFITHDFGVVTDIADQVIVMFRGRVVESGSVEDVLSSPKHPYTRALLDCVPDIEGVKPLTTMSYDWLEDDLLVS